MADVRVGMRLRSTTNTVPMEEFVTVTEITPRGFKYSLDAPYSMHPRLGLNVAKDGHEHFGMGDEAFFEVVDERVMGSSMGSATHVTINAMDAKSFMDNAKEIANAVAQQIRVNGPLTQELCQLVDARTH